MVSTSANRSTHCTGPEPLARFSRYTPAMPAVSADLSISSRWILPMTARDVLLEDHALIVRDGRILDVLPSDEAAERYAAAVTVERRDHLLIPGLVDARTCIAPERGAPRDFAHVEDSALLGIAALLKNGTTCFADVSLHPEETARAAAAQGLRAMIGIPLAETPSAWAGDPRDHLTRALHLRDEFTGHPAITTAFAPLHSSMSDAFFGRIATLANEVDAQIMMALHESRRSVEDSLARHGLRPIERLHALGLLSPALIAAHMVELDEADLALSARSGIAIALCPGAEVRRTAEDPMNVLMQSGLRLGLGTGDDPSTAGDPWTGLRLVHARTRGTDDGRATGAWDALAAATRGGAAALGLDADIGTLAAGKWADVCCIDTRGPAMVRAERAAPAGTPASAAAHGVVFGGGRDVVTDVWVAGRQLLLDGAFTRLDWPGLAERAARLPPPTTGTFS